MVVPLKNHRVYRVDDIYLYPMPIHKSYSSIKQQGKFVIGSKFKHSIKKQVLKIQYVFPRHLKVDQQVQMNTTDVLKFAFLNQIGVSKLDISSTYVPSKLKVTAILLPKQCEQENEYSFIFNGMDLWRDETQTWITSKIYNINCSFPYKLSSFLLDLPHKLFFEVCTAPKNSGLKQSLYLLPPVYNKAKSKWYVLTLILHSNMKYGSIIGTLKSIIISNNFCGNSFFVWYKTKWSWFEVSKRYPMKCLKLTFNQVIQSNFIDQKGSYEILLYLDKSFATFHTDSSVSEIIDLKQNKKLSYMEYHWQHRNQGGESYNQYKVILSKSKYSWNQAMKICTAHKSHLPVFKDREHLLETLQYLHLHYNFQFLEMFVGIIHTVSNHKLFFAYNIFLFIISVEKK